MRLVVMLTLSGMAAAVLLTACSGAEAPAPARPAAASAPAAAPPVREERDMLATLKGIADRTDAENSYLGDAEPKRLRAALQALPAETPLAARWDMLVRLGLEELRLGNAEEAVARLEEARLMLPSLGGEVPPGAKADNLYRLGIAWLRLGETRNCVARHTAQSCLFPIGKGGVHVEQEGSRQAIKWFSETLKFDGSDLAARWLLNIAYQTVGEWPSKVPKDWLIPPSAVASEEKFPRFEDIAPRLGVNVFDLSGGVILDDFDADGYLDIVTSTWDTRGPMHYFRNVGDGSFVDRTAEAGLTGELGGLNMIQADVDNDGDTDVLVLRGAWLLAGGRHPDSLLLNDGHGVFTDVTYRAGLAEVDYPSGSGAWGDYDNDGDLDLYVGNETDERNPVHPSQLFRNEGDGTFKEVARQAGVDNLRYAKSVSWGDYDGDRYLDLYVSNLNGENRLYHNRKDGTFEDVARAAGVNTPIQSFPAWFWDFDNDGALDIFASSWNQSVAALCGSYLGMPPQGELAKVYKGDGRGGFRDVAAEMGLVRMTIPMGSNFGDLDNDGWLDFYLGTGFPDYEALMPNVMCHNLGGKRFADVTTAGGFGHLQKGHAIAWGDIDNDGDEDIYEQMGGALPGDGFGNVLFENPGFGNHWIKLQLVGQRSNRSAIGARVRLDLAGPDGPRSIYRWVGSGATFGASPLLREIGIGRATTVQRIEIYWPTTDTTQEFRDVAADRCYRITESQLDLVPVDRTSFRFK